MPELEACLDRGFIFDSASNRRGKGTHFAVDPLQTFMRRQQGQGWFLQLDIASFFNHINQPTLLGLLAQGLRRALRRGQLTRPHARLLYRRLR